MKNEFKSRLVDLDTLRGSSVESYVAFNSKPACVCVSVAENAELQVPISHILRILKEYANENSGHLR